MDIYWEEDYYDIDYNEEDDDDDVFWGICFIAAWFLYELLLLLILLGIFEVWIRVPLNDETERAEFKCVVPLRQDSLV